MCTAPLYRHTVQYCIILCTMTYCTILYNTVSIVLNIVQFTMYDYIVMTDPHMAESDYNAIYI